MGGHTEERPARQAAAPLEERLARAGVSWARLSYAQTGDLVRRWSPLYGEFWLTAHRYGPPAIAAYEAEVCTDFFLGSVPGLGGGLDRAYVCRASRLPGLAEFDGLDLFVAPMDLSWTLVSHHEGGSCFMKAP